MTGVAVDAHDNYPKQKLVHKSEEKSTSFEAMFWGNATFLPNFWKDIFLSLQSVLRVVRLETALASVCRARRQLLCLQVNHLPPDTTVRHTDSQ